jgi:hypothetical protein
VIRVTIPAVVRVTIPAVVRVTIPAVVRVTIPVVIPVVIPVAMAEPPPRSRGETGRVAGTHWLWRVRGEGRPWEEL